MVTNKVPTKAELERALKLIAVGLKKEARRRSWCSEYEDWVKRINEEVGFDVLNVRVRRQRVSWQCDVMFRGAGVELDEMIDEFYEYVRAFKPTKGIEAVVDLNRAQFQDGGEEDAEGEASGTLTPDGYDPDAECNCLTCMQTRAAVQRADVNRVRFTDIVGS